MATLVASLGASALLAPHDHGSEGIGKAHMEISCAPALQPAFDRALAHLHNFWYARALARFQEIQKADADCAMAYWGAAMTYNHPLWDEPSREHEAAAWAQAQKGLEARAQNDHEHMYLLAVAALYKDAGAGTKRSRDEAYRDQMAATSEVMRLLESTRTRSREPRVLFVPTTGDPLPAFSDPTLSRMVLEPTMGSSGVVQIPAAGDTAAPGRTRAVCAR